MASMLKMSKTCLEFAADSGTISEDLGLVRSPAQHVELVVNTDFTWHSVSLLAATPEWFPRHGGRLHIMNSVASAAATGSQVRFASNCIPLIPTSWGTGGYGKGYVRVAKAARDARGSRGQKTSTITKLL